MISIGAIPFYQRLPVLVRETECRRIELQRLDRDQLRTLVETWMDLSQSDSNRLVDYLALHSDGNPFYATELMRTLHDRGLLAHRAGGWELAALDQLVLPPLLVHVIDSRISRLGDAMREWLAIAAVIGQEIPLPVWSDVAGMHEDQLLATVERAIDAHVMEANDQGTSVRFVHALTRNALYESVLPPRRREWHRRVARTLMASHSRIRTGGVPPANGRRARRLALAGKAAERARNAYAWASAIERYRAAVEHLRACRDQSIRSRKGRCSTPWPSSSDFPRPTRQRTPWSKHDDCRGWRMIRSESRIALGARHLALLLESISDPDSRSIRAMIESLQPLIHDGSLDNASVQQFIGGEVFSLRPGAVYAGDPGPQIPVEMSLGELIDAHLELVVWLQAAAGIDRSGAASE